jgi:hypothetical protein
MKMGRTLPAAIQTELGCCADKYGAAAKSAD